MLTLLIIWTDGTEQKVRWSAATVPLGAWGNIRQNGLDIEAIEILSYQPKGG